MIVKPVDQTREILPLPILKEILQTGLVISGGKGHGKSKTAKTILAEIIKAVNLHGIDIQCKIIDTACNWRWEFEPILFQEVNDTTTYIYNGSKHILYDTDLEDDKVFNFLQKISENDYRRQLELKHQFLGDRSKFGWKLYCVEEAQSSIPSFALRKNTGKKMLKRIAEGRNFNQCFVIIGQRLGNMSTNLIERCHGLMLGKMTGDNDLNKVRKRCGKDSGIDEEVKKLSIGEFRYWNGQSCYKFRCPDYDAKTMPIKWEPKPESVPVWEHFYGRRIL